MRRFLIATIMTTVAVAGILFYSGCGSSTRSGSKSTTPQADIALPDSDVFVGIDVAGIQDSAFYKEIEKWFNEKSSLGETKKKLETQKSEVLEAIGLKEDSLAGIQLFTNLEDEQFSIAVQLKHPINLNKELIEEFFKAVMKEELEKYPELFELPEIEVDKHNDKEILIVKKGYYEDEHPAFVALDGGRRILIGELRSVKAILDNSGKNLSETNKNLQGVTSSFSGGNHLNLAFALTEEMKEELKRDVGNVDEMRAFMPEEMAWLADAAEAIVDLQGISVELKFDKNMNIKFQAIMDSSEAAKKIATSLNSGISEIIKDGKDGGIGAMIAGNLAGQAPPEMIDELFKALKDIKISSSGNALSIGYSIKAADVITSLENAEKMIMPMMMPMMMEMDHEMWDY